jgi:hypothetical protein
MGIWTDAVEARARLIHQEIAGAQLLAQGKGLDPGAFTGALYDELARLYRDNYAYAQLADHADLIARFRGPGVVNREPPISLVTCLFGKLKEEIRAIARAIAGMEASSRVRWPADLDPQLAGVTHGSLVVGMRVPRPGDLGADGQALLPGVGDALYGAVQAAVQSLPAIPRLIQHGQVSEAIHEQFPDPAVRDTVMVAARRLAPSAQYKAINALYLSAPQQDQDTDSRAAQPLTRQSRAILTSCLDSPSRQRFKGTGAFEGLVRAVDLDARRFEIRGVGNSRGIRCIYEPHYDQLVGGMLDAAVLVKGHYEAAPDQQPRLVRVDEITVTREASRQLGLELEVPPPP